MGHFALLLGFEGCQQLLDFCLLDGGSSVLLVVFFLSAVFLFQVVLLLTQVFLCSLGDL